MGKILRNATIFLEKTSRRGGYVKTSRSLWETCIFFLATFIIYFNCVYTFHKIQKDSLENLYCFSMKLMCNCVYRKVCFPNKNIPIKVPYLKPFLCKNFPEKLPNAPLNHLWLILLFSQLQIPLYFLFLLFWSLWTQIGGEVWISFHFISIKQPLPPNSFALH